ncbi:unnamed protein product [Sympodiomycopsis kandeliae]
MSVSLDGHVLIHHVISRCLLQSLALSNYEEGQPDTLDIEFDDDTVWIMLVFDGHPDQDHQEVMQAYSRTDGSFLWEKVAVRRTNLDAYLIVQTTSPRQHPLTVNSGECVLHADNGRQSIFMWERIKKDSSTKSLCVTTAYGVLIIPDGKQFGLNSQSRKAIELHFIDEDEHQEATERLFVNRDEVRDYTLVTGQYSAFAVADGRMVCATRRNLIFVDLALLLTLCENEENVNHARNEGYCRKKALNSSVRCLPGFEPGDVFSLDLTGTHVVLSGFWDDGTLASLPERRNGDLSLSQHSSQRWQHKQRRIAIVDFGKMRGRQCEKQQVQDEQGQ